MLDTAGSYTLTASDGGTERPRSPPVSRSLRPAASNLVFGVQPSNVTAGLADQPVDPVDVEDTFGNIVTTDNSNVTLSVASGPESVAQLPWRLSTASPRSAT